MNSRQTQRYYALVDAIAPVIAGQSSIEIKSKVEGFRQITLGSLPKDDQSMRPGNPEYDAKAAEFGRLCSLMVPQEVDKCGGTVAQLALSILKQTGKIVAINRNRSKLDNIK